MDENNKMNDTLDDVTDEIIDFDEIEAQLESELEEKMSELQFLESERELIGNPDALGSTIKNVVWEQFLNQIGVTAGEDFIEANRGLTLDLRDSAHIQTGEAFEYGNIATHNTEIDYTSKYNEYMGNFRTDESNLTKEQSRIMAGEVKTARYDEKTKTFLRFDFSKDKWIEESRYNSKKGVWEEYDRIDDEWKKVLRDETVRAPYDVGREVGRNGKHNDHQISAGTIIRDPDAAAYMTLDERVEFAISKDNMHELDGAANVSKSDHDGEKWGKHIRTPKKGQGQTNVEYFGIDEEEFFDQDKHAKEVYEEKKKNKKEEAVKAGRKSQKNEAFRIGGEALSAFVKSLLAELLKEIIGKLVKWFKDKKKNFNSLIDSIKTAIKSFVSKLKKHMVNATNTLITTIATAIIGPVARTISKVWMMLKQGWKSLKDAVAFLKNPANQNMPMSIKVLEIGKIVMAGLSGVGALVLGEIIEKGLITIPALTVEIPSIGSLASIIGIFMGAVVAGIIGAIVINLLDNVTAKKRRELSIESYIDKGNEILKTQRELRDATVTKTDEKIRKVAETIIARHTEARELIRESASEIFDNETKDRRIDFDAIDSALDGLLDE